MSPRNRWPTRSPSTSPIRINLRPEHFFGSHCWKSCGRQRGGGGRWVGAKTWTCEGRMGMLFFGRLTHMPSGNGMSASAAAAPLVGEDVRSSANLGEGEGEVCRGVQRRGRSCGVPCRSGQASDALTALTMQQGPQQMQRDERANSHIHQDIYPGHCRLRLRLGPWRQPAWLPQAAAAQQRSSTSCRLACDPNSPSGGGLCKECYPYRQRGLGASSLHLPRPPLSSPCPPATHRASTLLYLSLRACARWLLRLLLPPRAPPPPPPPPPPPCRPRRPMLHPVFLVGRRGSGARQPLRLHSWSGVAPQHLPPPRPVLLHPSRSIPLVHRWAELPGCTQCTACLLSRLTPPPPFIAAGASHH